MRLVLCLLLALVSAPVYPALFEQSPETLYSYREVGQCRNGYVGESHTPRTRIKECLGLLVTKVTLRVSVESQTVTYVEEDRGFNKEFEPQALSVAKLKDCKILDRLNFACQGLERTEGAFTSTSAFGERKLSSSWICSKVASFSDGWVSVETLDFHETPWSTVSYVVAVLVVLAFFGGLAK